MESKKALTRNRYSLVIETKSEKTYVPINQYDRQRQVFMSGPKAELFIIDSRTTDFRNYEELGDYLYDQDLMKFPVESPEQIYIEYQSSGSKKLEIAYATDVEIKYFANKLKRAYQDVAHKQFQKNISQTDQKWNMVMNSFLNQIQQKNFFQYIKPYLNDKLIRDLNSQYLKVTKTDTQFIKRIISQEISRYKTLRGILIATRNYQNERNQDLRKWEEMVAILRSMGLETLLECYDLDEIIKHFPEVITYRKTMI